jgi:plasmid replication initiation protein
VFNRKENKVFVLFSPELEYFLSEFGEDKPFTKYYLEHVRKLNSINSVRLFRLASKHKNNFRTYGRDREFELLEFKRLLGVTGKYESIDNLKRKVIEPSMRDINANTNLSIAISYKKERNGDIKVKLSVREPNGTENEKL